VYDGCVDKSQENAEHAIKQHNVSYKYAEAPDVCETIANNIGLKMAQEDYCIIIQDDMIVNEEGWNERLLKPVNYFKDVYAVTAFASANITYNPRSKHIHEIDSDVVRPEWNDIFSYTENFIAPGAGRNVFGVRDVANRGPLLIKKEVLEKMDFLDEVYAPIELDEHDFHLRTFKETGMVCGAYNVNYISDADWGSTRSGGITKPWVMEANFKNAKTLWKRHGKMLTQNKHTENRIIE
jgi:GT2 family glycosyltransferase